MKMQLLLPLKFLILQRRNFLLKYFPDVVKKKLELKKGECIPDCGLCCFHLTHFCEHLDEHMRCRQYDKRIKGGGIFPLDRWEVLAYGVNGKCGYRFF